MYFLLAATILVFVITIIYWLIAPASQPTFLLKSGVSPEALKLSVISLAASCSAPEPNGAGLSTRLIKRNTERCYRAIAALALSGECFEFESRIYDSFYLIRDKAEYLRKALPKLRFLPHCGRYPRLYLLCQLLVKANGGAVSASQLSVMIDEFNNISPLTYGEISALPLCLEYALMEFIAIYCSKSLEICRWRRSAWRDVVRGRLNISGINSSEYLYFYTKYCDLEAETILNSIAANNDISVRSKTEHFAFLVSSFSGVLECALASLDRLKTWLTDELLLELSPLHQLLVTESNTSGLNNDTIFDTVSNIGNGQFHENDELKSTVSLSDSRTCAIIKSKSTITCNAGANDTKAAALDTPMFERADAVDSKNINGWRPVYSECTMATKNVYLYHIARRARRAGKGELAFARELITMASSRNIDIAELILPKVGSRALMRLYIAGILFFSAVLCVLVGFFIGELSILFAFFFFPSAVAITIMFVSELNSRIAFRRFLPRKMLSTSKAMITYCGVIATKEDVGRLFFSLKVARYANPNPNYKYALLLDFPAASAEECDADIELLNECKIQYNLLLEDDIFEKDTQLFSQGKENPLRKNYQSGAGIQYRDSEYKCVSRKRSAIDNCYMVFVRKRKKIRTSDITKPRKCNSNELNFKENGDRIKKTRGKNQYQGWEKKRGAILDLNDYLISGCADEFRMILGERPRAVGDCCNNCATKIDGGLHYSSTKDSGTAWEMDYVITLDCDTMLNCADELVEIMDHPFNRSKSIVSVRTKTNPYTVTTIFARLMCGAFGLDSYNVADGEAAFDLFDSGNYTGKGIFRVRQFNEKLKSFFPDGRILSHDFIEGAVAGCGCSESAVDNYPSTFSQLLTRSVRWLRGDWQLIPYLFRSVKNREGRRIKNPISPIAKWHIFCNMLFSLLPIFAFASLVASPFTSSPLIAVLISISYYLLTILNTVRVAIIGGKNPFLDIFKTIFNLAVLPIVALKNLGAILLTLLRLVVKRKLLEWKTFAHAKGKASNITLILSMLYFAGVVVFANASPLYFAICALFMFGVVFVFAFNHEYRRRKHIPSSFKQELLETARDTWSFFTDAGCCLSFDDNKKNAIDGMANDRKRAENEGLHDKFPHDSVAKNDAVLNASDGLIHIGSGLVSDNFQKYLEIGFADRTSPTNIGFSLLSVVCAFELGLIDEREKLCRIDKIIAAIESLDKWHGNLYNWIDLTGRPLEPRYVSSVDSGNLLACLIVGVGSLTKSDSINANINACNFGTVTDSASSSNCDAGDLASFSPDLKDSELKKNLARQLKRRINTLIDEMDIGALYDEKRGLLHIGYSDSMKTFDAHYDLLASESMLTYLVAIGCGKIPKKSFNNLARGALKAYGRVALASWTGGMFEYLMSALFIDFPAFGMLNRSSKAVINAHKTFAYREKLPFWGCSESQFAYTDELGNYQYKAFGVPAICNSNRPPSRVVAPYATFLALTKNPTAVRKNLRRIRASGMLGEYGYFESMDCGLSAHEHASLSEKKAKRCQFFTNSIGKNVGEKRDIRLSDFGTQANFDKNVDVKKKERLGTGVALESKNKAVGNDDARLRNKHGGSGEVVQTYMAHHQGMILAAICNYLCDNVIASALKKHPAIAAAEMLLTQGEFHAITKKRKPRKARKYNQSHHIIPRDTFPPTYNVLSNGGYTVAHGSDGECISTYFGKCVSRADSGGLKIFVATLSDESCPVQKNEQSGISNSKVGFTIEGITFGQSPEFMQGQYSDYSKSADSSLIKSDTRIRNIDSLCDNSTAYDKHSKKNCYNNSEDNNALAPIEQNIAGNKSTLHTIDKSYDIKEFNNASFNSAVVASSESVYKLTETASDNLFSDKLAFDSSDMRQSRKGNNQNKNAGDADNLRKNPSSFVDLASGSKIFSTHKTEYEIKTPEYLAQMTAFVLPNLNGEMRRVTLKNLTDKQLSFMVCSYFEPALTDKMQDIAHKTFSSMKLRTEFEGSVIVACRATAHTSALEDLNENGQREKHDGHESAGAFCDSLYLAHYFAEDGVEYESSKHNLIFGKELPSFGAPLYPALSGSKVVELLSGETITLNVFVLISDKKDSLLSNVGITRIEAFFRQAISSAHSHAALKKLDRKTLDLLPAIMYPDGQNIARDHAATFSEADSNLRVSTEFTRPFVLIEAGDAVIEIETQLCSLSLLQQLVNFDIVITYTELPGYFNRTLGKIQYFIEKSTVKNVRTINTYGNSDKLAELRQFRIKSPKFIDFTSAETCQISNETFKKNNCSKTLPNEGAVNSSVFSGESESLKGDCMIAAAQETTRCAAVNSTKSQMFLTKNHAAPVKYPNDGEETTMPYACVLMTAPTYDLPLGDCGFLDDSSFFIEVNGKQRRPWCNVLGSNSNTDSRYDYLGQDVEKNKNRDTAMCVSECNGLACDADYGMNKVISKEGGGIGAVITESGGGYTFFENSGTFKITEWTNEPISDMPSEGILISESEVVWSITRQPFSPSCGAIQQVTFNNSNCVKDSMLLGKGGTLRDSCRHFCHHGFGFTEFSCNYNGFIATQTEFTDLKNSRYKKVFLKNYVDKERIIDIYLFLNLVMGDNRESTRGLVDINKNGESITIRNRANGKTVFLKCSSQIEYYVRHKQAMSCENHAKSKQSMTASSKQSCGGIFMKKQYSDILSNPSVAVGASVVVPPLGTAEIIFCISAANKNSDELSK